MLKFLRHLCSRVSGTVPPAPSDVLHSPSDLDRARLYWIKDSQSHLQRDEKFPLWERQLDLFIDESGMWKCGGRMSNLCLSPASQTPILLDKRHYLTTMIVTDAHRRVMHDGVKETLTELRLAYWLIRGRQFVCKLIHACVVCRKLEGGPCRGNHPPPLPEYRV